MQLFACENAVLIVKLNQFFAAVSPELLEKLPPELKAEWTDFFVEGIYNLLLPLPLSITGNAATHTTKNDDPILCSKFPSSYCLFSILLKMPSLSRMIPRSLSRCCSHLVWP